MKITKQISILFIIVFSIFLLVSCEDNNKGKVINGSLRNRNYRIYLPNEFDINESYNLVVVLHGCGQNAKVIAEATKFDKLADEKKFIVLYPEQLAKYHPRTCWNWYKASFEDESISELKIIVDQINYVKDKYQIDNVFAHGLSAGGAMVSSLAAIYPYLFSGIGITAGIPHKVATSSPEGRNVMALGPKFSAEEVADFILDDMKENQKTIKTIVFQGLNDLTVNYKNGDVVAKSWAIVNNYNNEIVQQLETIKGLKYTYTTYRKDSEVLVKYYLIDNMTHTWPNGIGMFEQLDAAKISYDFWTS